MSKQADLHDALRRLHSTVDGVNGTVLGTRDGLPIASTLVGGTGDTVAAMAATVLALAEQAVPGSAAERTAVIRGRGGCLVVQAAGRAAVLAVQTGPKPNLGLIHLEAPVVAAAVGDALVPAEVA